MNNWHRRMIELLAGFSLFLAIGLTMVSNNELPPLAQATAWQLPLSDDWERSRDYENMWVTNPVAPEVVSLMSTELDCPPTRSVCHSWERVLVLRDDFGTVPYIQPED